MARPLVLAVWLVLGLARGAEADPKTSKVRIETDPPGAKVYFNVKEDGEVCTTPCTIDAPIGETPIIVEAENRRSIIENLIVPKKTARPMHVQYKLKPALGTLIVEGGDGATITIDDENQGTAPRRIEDVLAGAHHVVLEKSGKKLFDAFVEVEIGREVTVTPRVAAETPPATPERDVPAITAARSPSTTEARRTPVLAISATTEIGFRQFDFNYPTPTSQSNQKNDREVGEVLTGGMIELWPTTLLHLGFLPGLALYGRFAIGLNPQAVAVKDGMTGQLRSTSLETAWRNFEVSVRQRWMIGSTGSVEVSAGYLSDRYQFSTSDPINGTGERSVVPDAAYKSVRIGGRVSLLFDWFEPYLALENRLIISGGVLESRYELGGMANGLHGALGGVAHLGNFEVRVGGSITRYSWSFQPGRDDEDQADGGTDLIEKITLALGYVY